jgi:hypothetical protein
MPVMLWITALPAMVEIDGITTAATTVLNFPWLTVSLPLRLPK